MSDTFLLEIVTPYALILSEEVEYVTAPGVEGEFGVLKGHTPFMTALKPGEVVCSKGNFNAALAVSWGYAEVTHEKVIVLVETAEKAEEIDIERAKTSLTKAEERLRRLNKEDKEYLEAAASLEKAVIRVQVAGRLSR
ncbi:MAG: ATP synthase F1 subunit epsilon [Deltaproteobacteria bacterium GWC2_42_11]|nr:MAG: ATP synthase F1 subunit epsilon [Deltaproteobacteria bacterium GWC2_42_11]HBO83491.1 F0F1 ATP synthase subunit epsilon [Deltaproteobacteria bacterium]